MYNNSYGNGAGKPYSPQSPYGQVTPYVQYQQPYVQPPYGAPVVPVSLVPLPGTPLVPVSTAVYPYPPSTTIPGPTVVPTSSPVFPYSQPTAYTLNPPAIPTSSVHTSPSVYQDDYQESGDNTADYAIVFVSASPSDSHKSSSSAEFNKKFASRIFHYLNPRFGEKVWILDNRSNSTNENVKIVSFKDRKNAETFAAMINNDYRIGSTTNQGVPKNPQPYQSSGNTYYGVYLTLSQAESLDQSLQQQKSTTYQPVSFSNNWEGDTRAPVSSSSYRASFPSTFDDRAPNSISQSGQRSVDNTEFERLIAKYIPLERGDFQVIDAKSQGQQGYQKNIKLVSFIDKGDAERFTSLIFNDFGLGKSTMPGIQKDVTPHYDEKNGRTFFEVYFTPEDAYQLNQNLNQAKSYQTDRGISASQTGCSYCPSSARSSQGFFGGESDRPSFFGATPVPSAPPLTRQPNTSPNVTPYDSTTTNAATPRGRGGWW